MYFLVLSWLLIGYNFLFCVLFYYFKILTWGYVYWFERGGAGGALWETIGCLPLWPDLGLNTQPVYVPWFGIELTSWPQPVPDFKTSHLFSKIVQLITCSLEDWMEKQLFPDRTAGKQGKSLLLHHQAVSHKENTKKKKKKKWVTYGGIK